MYHQCILCGQHHSTGLNIAGCFLCFSCERALLHPAAAQRLSRPRRLRLMRLYDCLSPSSATK